LGLSNEAWPSAPGQGHVGEHILFGTIHQRGEFRHLRPDPVGDITPLGFSAFGVPWAKAVAMKAETTHRALFPA
jgi:hypothetical protein